MQTLTKPDSAVTVFEEAITGGLGRMTIHHPAGTFAPTPASRIMMEAIAAHQAKLRGVGLDWGCGVGCLAILAAKIKAVAKVYGLDIAKSNVEAAEKNAAENGVAEKVRFMVSNSYTPFSEEDQQALNRLRGKLDFIVSNPPSSDGDDGFSFRRMVMSGAQAYLKKDGIILLNVSFQYGAQRLASLCQHHNDFNYLGLAASTDWVPFDLTRQDLFDCLKTYVREEANGGMPYTFKESIVNDARVINAREALNNYNRYGTSPLMKWQTHMFRYIG